MIALGEVEARARGLVESLRAWRSGRLKVRNFRINYSEGRSATLGIYDSKAGSVYSPFQLSDAVRGSLLVEWTDGMLSRAAIDGNAGNDLALVLEGALDARYRDDEARAFAGPARPRPTRIFDPRVDALVSGRFGRLYDLVDLIGERGRRVRAKKVSGSAQASVGVHVVATSRGLWHAAPSSECRFSFSYDAELWDGRSRRTPFTVAEAARVIDRAAALLPSLRRRAKGVQGGAARVLCFPHFAEELFESYVLGNLYGAEVATGQAAFKPDDFRKRKQVFREDLALVVDPTVPWSSGSYRITAEGLPARREVYIERGRLMRPIVGVKYAKRLKMKPSTPPASMESVHIGFGRPSRLAAALSGMGEGFVVLSALGLHTQDTASGDYSITAPQAIAVRGGRFHGSTKTVLAGNFFANLRDERTRLVSVPGYRFPGLLIDAHVTVG